jgi:hypothetical protein
VHLPTTLAPWSPHDTQLVLSCVLGLALIIVFISALKLAPFLSILVGTFAAGFTAGLPLEAVASAFSKGAGALLGDVGIIIALGAMLGALMAESGAADRLVSTILKHSTPRVLPWMMALVAIIVGLPLFFEVGLVMMVPIIFVMARRSKQPILLIAIPALAGMTTLHALLPPHPGPLIAVSALHADLGLTLLLGLIVAIPAVILAGPVYGIWLSKRMNVTEPEEMGKLFTAQQDAAEPPSFAISLITILLPVILMLGRTVAKLLLQPETFLFNALNFLGEPLVALGLTVLFAIVALGWSRGMPRDRVARHPAQESAAHRRAAADHWRGRRAQAGAGGCRHQHDGRQDRGGRPYAADSACVADRRRVASGHRLGYRRDDDDGRHCCPGRHRPESHARFTDGAGNRRGLGVFLPRERRGFLDGARVFRPETEADGVRVVDPADDRVGGRSRAHARDVERPDLRWLPR